MKSLLIAILAGFVCTAYAADQHQKAETTAATARKYKNVGPEAFDKLRHSETNAVVLDVRTKEEYDKGHIAGAVLMDISSADFNEKIAKLDKNKTYLVHCAAGGRSARACKKMADAKIPKLFNLEGGMTAWEKAGKPVEK